jgi:uroporphyrinogen decarboxylase
MGKNNDNYSSKEIVKLAIKFKGPPRIPFDLPEPYGSDIAIITQQFPEDIKLENGKRMDMWGAIWQTLDEGMGEITDPPIKNLDDYSNYQWPPLLKDELWQTVIKQVEAGRKNRKYLIAGLVTSLFERMHHLRGLSSLMMDFHDNCEAVEKMADDIVTLICELLDRHALIGADAMMFCDDWGLQERLMISPDMWRTFYKPRYARIFGHAHKLGLDTFMHSCGYIVDILDDLIEIGLDVIQMDQQMNMGLDLLSERFGGRITFWCPADIQAIMPNLGPKEIQDYTKQLVYKLGNFNGGFIGKWYPSPEAVNHSSENIKAMAEIFCESEYPLREVVVI